MLQETIKIAILDLYEGAQNQGMRCIKEIINLWGDYNNLCVSYEVFEVRLKHQTPDLSFDAYISTGGPGSPLESEGSDWENVYFKWLQSVEAYNSSILNTTKKHVFFICHSFQLVCRHYKVANVCKRKSTSFGVFPITMLDDGKQELVFEGLLNPFYVVDSRDYQVIDPNYSVLEKMGATLLCLEKERPHVALQRAIMGIRFSPYFIGTQFHPEADATGMLKHLETPERKKVVVDTHGLTKWENMVEHLQDPDKILFTYSKILPNFLNEAIGLNVATAD
ncbi:MAG: type 1 glutamine amidotransferase [Chitinophagaceae bacterium]